MIRMFRSTDFVQAVELVDFTSIQKIIQLTGMAVTVEFSNNGALQSITLKSGSKTVVAAPRQFVYRNSTGTVGVCDLDWLQENYEEVTPVEDTTE